MPDVPDVHSVPEPTSPHAEVIVPPPDQGGHSGGGSGGSILPTLGRIFLVLVVLAIAGIILYTVWTMRYGIVNKITELIVLLLIVAAILLYLNRRRWRF